jgi:acetyltransferase-like isoleucine patch superfamily enzyme
MSALADKLLRALARDRNLSTTALARKLGANAVALARGTVALRACDRVGARPRCFGSPLVQNRGSIAIGDDFAVACTFGTALLATGPRGAIEIGRGVTVNFGAAILCGSRIRLGDGVMIGPYCVVSDSAFDPSIAEVDEPRPIEIGDGVWLAARVVVRPGVRIGAGTVVAAGSVVESDLPSGAVASGAPARVLRVRSLAEARRAVA